MPRVVHTGDDDADDYPPPSRGASATINLYFDGSASPNPGPGGWGAIAYISVTPRAAVAARPPTTHRLDKSGKLGDVTNNTAEYMGLIGGMRAVIQYLQSAAMRHAYADLRIFGDSELVIAHMEGRYFVLDPKLTALYDVAKGLERQFLRVRYAKVSREKNERADRIANDARSDPLPVNCKAVYYPSQLGFVDVWVEGRRTLGSMDLITAGSDPSFFVDARFLGSLPGYGAAALRNLSDPYPLAVVVGNTNMTVLGTVDLGVGVRWKRDACAEPRFSGFVNVIVVDSLPVPLHVSVKNGNIELTGRGFEVSSYELMQVPFEASSLPVQYREHPYWTGDTIFIGFEAGS